MYEFFHNHTPEELQAEIYILKGKWTRLKERNLLPSTHEENEPCVLSLKDKRELLELLSVAFALRLAPVVQEQLINANGNKESNTLLSNQIIWLMTEMKECLNDPKFLTEQSTGKENQGNEHIELQLSLPGSTLRLYGQDWSTYTSPSAPEMIRSLLNWLGIRRAA